MELPSTIIWQKLRQRINLALEKYDIQKKNISLITKPNISFKIREILFYCHFYFKKKWLKNRQIFLGSSILTSANVYCLELVQKPPEFKNRIKTILDLIHLSQHHSNTTEINKKVLQISFQNFKTKNFIK
jgi:hypothetical protein